MVSYHDMRNISYITQDPEDKRVFAYIAKDAKTDKHYCHVFRVESNVSRLRYNQTCLPLNEKVPCKLPCSVFCRRGGTVAQASVVELLP